MESEIATRYVAKKLVYSIVTEAVVAETERLHGDSDLLHHDTAHFDVPLAPDHHWRSTRAIVNQFDEFIDMMVISLPPCPTAP